MPARSSLALIAALASACAGAPRHRTVVDDETIPLVVTSTGPETMLARIDLVVDGAPLRFLLDTGAAISSVAVDTRTKRYPSLGPDLSTGVSGKAVPCDVVQPNEIRLGRHRFATPRITRCDRNVLGMDLLGTVIFQIDLAGHVLRLVPSLPHDLPRQRMQRLRRGHVSIPIRIGVRPLWALFDTGADTTVIDSAFVDEHPELFALARTEPGRDAHGHAVESKIYRCSSMDIGPIRWKDVEVAAFDFGSYLRSRMEGAPIIVGNNIISKGRWTFDVGAGWWSVEPNGPRSATERIQP